MAMPQRDKYIADLERTEALLEHAIRNGEFEQIERLREQLNRLADLGECRVWDGKN
jgi:hypothetical protein